MVARLFSFVFICQQPVYNTLRPFFLKKKSLLCRNSVACSFSFIRRATIWLDFFYRGNIELNMGQQFEQRIGTKELFFLLLCVSEGSEQANAEGVCTCATGLNMGQRIE